MPTRIYTSRNQRPIAKRNHRSRNILLGVLAVLVIAGGSFAYFQSHKTAKVVTKPNTTTTDSSANYSTKPLDPTQVNADNNARKDNPSTSATLSNPTANPDLSVTITRVSNSAVFTEVDGATSGSCSLDAKQPGRADVTATSTVIQNVNSYQCDDFKLASNQFASGHWSITVTVVSNGASVTSDVWQL